MTIVLLRVDERLIHGQVVIGWGSQLTPSRYVVVDDELAESGWEQELYRLSISDGSEVAFLAVDDARDSLAVLEEDEDRTILLTRDVASMARLGRDGALAGRSVNLGGLHFGEGKTKVSSYLYLSREDRKGIRELVEGGAAVTGRDLPDSARVDQEELLGEDEHE